MAVISLVFYVTFGILCILNIITGIYVENASKLIQQDADMMIMQEQKDRNHWVRNLANVLLKGIDGRDRVNCDEFRRYVEDPAVQAYFRRVGLHVEADNAEALFDLLDFDECGTVTVEAFICGCSKVVGGARQLDIARVGHSLKKLIVMVNDLDVLCRKHFPMDTVLS
eukprot:NODE_347_length_1646_cov_343.722187.p1 GENE.NODE_347_length_1646_cov_343.722187~~NODE_347_length_1646_cov_343.722187.p1  ORF type:complete len:168 (+),score=60.50 NODE_347_length_1646_cov_343.722187:1035-1538(+)